MRNISCFLDNLVRPALTKYGLAQTKLLTEWHLIIGPRLSDYSLPKKVIFPRGKKIEGTLHIEVHNSGLNTEIYYLENLILERIAIYFGYRAISKIKITVNPEVRSIVPIKPISKALSIKAQLQLNQQTEGLDDDQLRLALYHLGSHIVKH